MTTIIRYQRHYKSEKHPVLGKVPAASGIEDSYQNGLEDAVNHPNHEVRCYHSSAIRTEMPIDAYLMGRGQGSKEHLSQLDSVEGPEEIDRLRKDLGDDESNKIKLARYDRKGNSSEPETTTDYYERLYQSGKSIADYIIGEIKRAVEDPDKNEIVQLRGHEPSMSVSLIELAKKLLGYKGEDNASYFRELSGSDVHYFIEGTEYTIEVREVDGEVRAFLTTEAGEVELDISGIVPEAGLEERVAEESEEAGEEA
ncbi:MAG: hypothetical protein V1740_08425 [Candidatus Woesearchaeota archaeon]